MCCYAFTACGATARISMSLSLLLFLLLVCGTQANRFLGTVMTYYPNNTVTDGSVAVVVRYKLNFRLCTDLRWECLRGNCGNESVVVSTVDTDGGGEWCQTEGISTRGLPSNAPFQLWLNASDWVDNITNGVVNVTPVTLVELRNRSDTRQANASPQTTVLPSVRVPSNCRRNFSLLAFDPDGDNVACRYENTSLSVLGLSSPCSLSFSPTNSSNEGPYAVQLAMEDFPRQTITLTQDNGVQTTLTTSDAISKIPVQFVLWVTPAVSSCTPGLYLPLFLPPTPAHGARLHTPVSHTLTINITAQANISSVSELLYSGPYDLVQNTSGPEQFSLSWTPSQREAGESHPICFIVKAARNDSIYHSDLRCVVVTVGNDPTATAAPNRSNATTPLTFNTTATPNITAVTPSAPSPTTPQSPTNSTTPFTADSPSGSPTPGVTTPFTTPSSAVAVIGLSGKITSTVPLTDTNIATTLNQVKIQLVNLGLPSDIVVRLVSIAQQ